jgi:hypothetical protein
MGGGSKQKAADPSAVNPTRNAAVGAAEQSQNLGSNFSAQQQQLYNMLWGPPGGGTGGGDTRGAVASFLDPSKLNVSSPTGPFALQYTKQKEQLAKQFQDAQGATNRTLAQGGFGPGTPSGFSAALAGENARGLANATGDAFTKATTNSYNDALQNFWRAAQMAQGGSTAAGQGALQGTGTAANVYNNLYGTATKPYTTQSNGIVGPAIGAAGTVGAAAMCVANATLVRMADGSSKLVEHLIVGDELAGVNAKPNRVSRIERKRAKCLKLLTEKGQSLVCSESHTLLVPSGGYIRAEDAIGAEVLAADGPSRVEAFIRAGEFDVYRIETDGTHSYLSDGIWSLE